MTPYIEFLEMVVENRKQLQAVQVNPQWFHVLMTDEQFQSKVSVDYSKGFNYYLDIPVLLISGIEKWNPVIEQ